MKQIKHVVFIFLTIFFVNISGISQEVTWGELNDAKTKNYYPTIIGEDETGIYAFSVLKNDFIIEKYARNNKTKLFEKSVDQPKIGKARVTLEHVVYANGKFVILASYYEKSSDTYKLYGFTIDGNTGEKNANIDLLSIPVEKRIRKGSYMVISSEDRTKILINHYAYYKEEKAYRDKYILLDDNLNIILSKEEKIYKGTSKNLIFVF